MLADLPCEQTSFMDGITIIPPTADSYLSDESLSSSNYVSVRLFTEAFSFTPKWGETRQTQFIYRLYLAERQPAINREGSSMRSVSFAAAAIVGLAAAPASAVTFTAVNGSSAVFTSSAAGAQYTFETSTTGNLGDPTGFLRAGGQVMSGNSTGVGANPFGAPNDNDYLYVVAGGVSTISSIAAGITGYQNISFYIGSIDAGNTVSLLGAGGVVLQSFGGAALASPESANGQQTIPGTNRLITFTAGAGEVLTGIRFSSSVNSLEADNVRFTSAVPEPATWAMMLLGFTMVGAAARYRRRTSKVRFA